MENTIQQKIEQKSGIDLRKITEKISYAYAFISVVLLFIYIAFPSVVYNNIDYRVLYYPFLFIGLVVLSFTLFDLHKKPVSPITLLSWLISIIVLFFTPYVPTFFKLVSVVIIFCYGIYSLSSESIIRKTIAWLIIIGSLFYLIAAIAIPLAMKGII